MNNFSTARFDANEIARNTDFDYTQTQLIGNLHVLFNLLLEATADVVLSGLTVAQRSTPSMNIDISAGLSFCQSTALFAHIESALGPVAIANGGGADRYDIVEIRLLETPYDQQQRAYRDPVTGQLSTQDWDTKLRYSLEAQVVQGTSGGSAPNHTAGWVKIAEVRVPAGESTSIVTSYIKNVSTGKDGGSNTGWTTEATSTFKIQNLVQNKTLFRTQHDEDGDHSDDFLKAHHIDLGAGADQVDADILPLGTDVTNTPTGGTATSLASGTDVRAALQEAFNRMIDLSGVGNDAVKNRHVDFGLGATQVKAADIPIVDALGQLVGTEVEAALQELSYCSRHASYIYASSDSSTADKAAADEVISVAADAGAIITAKITALNSAGGGTIFFSVGTYLLQTAVVLRPYVNIKGSGKGTLFVRGGTDGSMMTADTYGYEQVILSDFTLDGVKATYASVGYHGLVGSTSGTVDLVSIVSNVYVQNCAGIAFYWVYGISNCTSDSCKTGFYYCRKIFKSSAFSSATIGFQSCTDTDACTSYSNGSAGFVSCTTLGNCKASDNTTSGFSSCSYLVNCQALDNTGVGFTSCLYCTTLYSTGNSDGFYLCEYLSSCKASGNAGEGFSGCLQLSNCMSNSHHTGTAEYLNCSRLSNCYSTDGGDGAINYSGCHQLNGCYAYNASGNHGFSSCTKLSNCVANVSGGAKDFTACKTMHGCQSLGGGYQTSYADSGTTNAVADTADGGYNY